ncbi:hypothetical protein [Candidatus Villigracilis affinis]|uniref:hypothetical protein n=1 Tax=Candidatus Villigracilis affinis TaxID=3140682 RepID=UPI001D29DC9D|nr:hypothetical protein [Anaerolineales bacterium]
MDSKQMLQQVKYVIFKGMKSITPFSIAAMTLWVILLTLWFWSVGLFDWIITNSFSYFPIIAIIYLAVDILDFIGNKQRACFGR